MYHPNQCDMLIDRLHDHGSGWFIYYYIVSDLTCYQKQQSEIRYVYLTKYTTQKCSKHLIRVTSRVLVWLTVLNATFNNISVTSWQSILLVEETGVSRENLQPIESHWQTWSHNVVSSTPHHEQGLNSQL